MSFVKLDCGMLNSSIWIDRPARELFITALLMAEPWQTPVALEAMQPDSLEANGFIVPPGWYGFVRASPVGVIRASCMDIVEGRDALRRLLEPDGDSRSQAFEGRRLARVNGGLVVLNYDAYRQRDYTATERSRRYRERLMRDAASTDGNAVTDPNVTRDTVTQRRCNALQGVTQRHATQAEEEAEAEAEKNHIKPRIINVKPPIPPAPMQWADIRVHYPARVGSQDWRRALVAANARIREGDSWDDLLAGAKRYAAFCKATGKAGTEYVMQAARFFGPSRAYAEPWQAPAANGHSRPPVDLEAARAAQEAAERRKQASIEAARRQFSGQSSESASDRPALLPLPDLSIGR